MLKKNDRVLRINLQNYFSYMKKKQYNNNINHCIRLCYLGFNMVFKLDKLFN